jgi:hypothetical protein
MSQPLTCFLIHRDRTHSAAALASVQSQRLACKVVVVPANLLATQRYEQCLTAQTPYTLVLEDDVELAPDAAMRLVRAVRWRRMLESAVYSLRPQLHDELTGNRLAGDVRLYSTELLRKVGSPDSPRAASLAHYRARVLGLSEVAADLVVGTRRAGAYHEVYERLFWDKVRSRLGLWHGLEPTVAEYDALYRHQGRIEHLFAAAGILDACTIKPKAGAMPEHVLGPIGATLRFDSGDEPRLRAILADTRVGATGRAA